MTYLYGDSTDSGLELNYIELLRAFLDFAVEVVLSEQRITARAQNAVASKENAENEFRRLRGLGVAINDSLDKTRNDDSKSCTNQTIVAIGRSVEIHLRAAADSLRQGVRSTEQELLLFQQQERAKTESLIEPLVLEHQLPDSSNSVNLQISQDGLSYQFEVLGSCKQGLGWRFEAEIPSGHIFKDVIRIASVASDLTISVPELSGFVRKSIKLKPYRVYPLYLIGLSHEQGDIVAQLRASPALDDETGLNIRLAEDSPQISISRILKGEVSPPFTAQQQDATKLRALLQNFSHDSSGLVETRCKLLAITFDKEPLALCANPIQLLSRLIQRIGPVITTIAQKSLTSDELVLKQVLANGRREEIFASKSNLRASLATIPKSAQWVFKPLGLSPSAHEEAQSTESEPASEETEAGEIPNPFDVSPGEEDKTAVVEPKDSIQSGDDGIGDRRDDEPKAQELIALAPDDNNDNDGEDDEYEGPTNVVSVAGKSDTGESGVASQASQSESIDESIDKVLAEFDG